MPLDALLERVESNVIRLALERSRDNKSAAAEILGINRARLYRRMEQLGLGSPDEDDPDDSPGGAPSA
jgi:DNA-binding NtrC family response regulator